MGSTNPAMTKTALTSFTLSKLINHIKLKRSNRNNHKLSNTVAGMDAKY